MGHVTRHEVAQLIQKFEEKVLPEEARHGSHPLRIGIDRVHLELKKTAGAPTVLLRSFARVLKHYIEAPKDALNVSYANHVLSRVEAVGAAADVGKLIKRAPRDYQLAGRPKVGIRTKPFDLSKLVDALEEAGV